MRMNRIQFQPGESMPDLFARYGREEHCAAGLSVMRWPDRFRCPRCDCDRDRDRDCEAHYFVCNGPCKLFQCQSCRHQTSLTTGTVLESTKLPLRILFLAIYLISQDKTGLSSMALKRHLGTSNRTIWLVHCKLIPAVTERDALEPLASSVKIDDAYLGGEKLGVGGLGSHNNVRTFAAISTSDTGRPMRVKLAAVGSATREAIANWSKANLLPSCDVRSDGLSCFATVIDAGCAQSCIIVGQRKPRDLPRLTWVHAVLDNLKTMIGRGRKASKYEKWASYHLGAIACRFKHRANLHALPAVLDWRRHCLAVYAQTSDSRGG